MEVRLSTYVLESRRAPRQTDQSNGLDLDAADIRLIVPWWMNPLWALILLTGTMSVVSVLLPPTVYETWLEPKFLDGNLSQILLLLFLCLGIGVLTTSGISPRPRTVEIHLTPSKLSLLKKAYKILFWLTFIGYAAWTISALLRGVGLADLIGVLERSPGAISMLKASASPIGGVTTLTQFAPFAVGINLLLWKIGDRRLKSLLFFFAAATVRVLFYAERLALIEVLVPFVLVGAMLLSSNPRGRKLVAIGPALAVPLIWGVFAFSEYFRSWIYYSKFTDMPFVEWVTVRLIGYYVTSFNNSALLARTYESDSPLPWFSLQWFWNLPGVESMLTSPTLGGVSADKWWTGVLLRNANYNFTNTGSFLTTYAEFGLVGSMLVWLVTGLIIGALFASMTKGHVPSLLLYVTMFVGILELPRMVYWTLGRSTPLVIATLFLAYQWAKPELQKRRQAAAGQRAPDLIRQGPGASVRRNVDRSRT